VPNVLGVPDSAKKLGDTYVAGEPISALQVVRLDTSSEAYVGDPITSFESASSVGIALNGGGIGTNIDVQNFGILEDAFFTFPTNTPLFLSPTGTITDVAPVAGYNVQVGQSLGTGSIFINIREPISI
jgi:hypothetical protein